MDPMGYCMYEYHFYHYIIHLILKPWGVPSHTQQFFHWVIGHKILLWTKSHPCRHRTCKTSQNPAFSQWKNTTISHNFNMVPPFTRENHMNKNGFQTWQKK